MNAHDGLSLMDLISMKKDAIKKMLDAAKKYEERVVELWYPDKGVERSSGLDFTKVISIDGSKIHVEFQSLSLFIVRALSFLLDLKGKSGVHRVRSLYGIVSPPYKSNDRSILYMESLEVELVRELIDEIERSSDTLILADGALSTMSQCRTYEGNKCSCSLKYESISQVLNDKTLSGSCKVCLECAVKQYNLWRLMKMKPFNLFYVAKKYHSNVLFKDKELDDLTILFFVITHLNKDLDGVGATVPARKTVKLPLVGKKEEVWFFYAKFKRGGNLYYVEVPREISLEDALRFVRRLSLLSTNEGGYPLPLKWAHKSVELPERAIKPILERTYAFFRSGREGL